MVIEISLGHLLLALATAGGLGVVTTLGVMWDQVGRLADLAGYIRRFEDRSRRWLDEQRAGLAEAPGAPVDEPADPPPTAGGAAPRRRVPRASVSGWPGRLPTGPRSRFLSKPEPRVEGSLELTGWYGWVIPARAGMRAVRQLWRDVCEALGPDRSATWDGELYLIAGQPAGERTQSGVPRQARTTPVSVPAPVVPRRPRWSLPPGAYAVTAQRLARAGFGPWRVSGTPTLRLGGGS